MRPLAPFNVGARFLALRATIRAASYTAQKGLRRADPEIGSRGHSGERPRS